MTHAQIHGYLCSAQFPNHNHYLAWWGLGEKGGFKGGPLLCGSVKYVGRDIHAAQRQWPVGTVGVALPVHLAPHQIALRRYPCSIGGGGVLDNVVSIDTRSTTRG